MPSGQLMTCTGSSVDRCELEKYLCGSSVKTEGWGKDESRKKALKRIMSFKEDWEEMGHRGAKHHLWPKKGFPARLPFCIKTRIKRHCNIPKCVLSGQKEVAKKCFQLGEEAGFQNRPLGLTSGEFGFLPFNKSLTRISEATKNGPNNPARECVFSYECKTLRRCHRQVSASGV